MTRGVLCVMGAGGRVCDASLPCSCKENCRQILPNILSMVRNDIIMPSMKMRTCLLSLDHASELCKNG